MGSGTVSLLQQEVKGGYHKTSHKTLSVQSCFLLVSILSVKQKAESVAEA